jgi:hypothetical protein
MGLDNLLTIMEYNKGSMTILSNKGVLAYTYSDHKNSWTVKASEKDFSYIGTLIKFNFRTDTLDIEEEEEFEWL